MTAPTGSPQDLGDALANVVVGLYPGDTPTEIRITISAVGSKVELSNEEIAWVLEQAKKTVEAYPELVTRVADDLTPGLPNP